MVVKKSETHYQSAPNSTSGFGGSTELKQHSIREMKNASVVKKNVSYGSRQA
jgi:hypothetical protein